MAKKIKFYSTKRFGPITTTHRNWKARLNASRDSSHCADAHGYSRYVEFTFQGDLDDKQWVFDFGDSKQLKNFIELYWDHKTLINSDDPLKLEFLEAAQKGMMQVVIMDVTKGWGAGIEGSCKFLYDNLNPIVDKLTNGRVSIKKIQVWEHENNSAFIEVEDD